MFRAVYAPSLFRRFRALYEAISAIWGSSVQFWATLAQARPQKHTHFSGSWVGAEHYLRVHSYSQEHVIACILNLADIARHVIRHVLSPRVLSEMAFYDVASSICQARRFRVKGLGFRVCGEQHVAGQTRRTGRRLPRSRTRTCRRSSCGSQSCPPRTSGRTPRYSGAG
jgi:hypothetical protein